MLGGVSALKIKENGKLYGFCDAKSHERFGEKRRRFNAVVTYQEYI